MIRRGLRDEEKADTSTVTGIIIGHKRRNEVWRNKFHARDMAYCPRKAILMRLVSKEKTSSWDSKSEFYTGIGNGVHDAVCEVLRQEGVLVEGELRLENPWLEFGGYVDALVKIEDEFQIIEIKTCKRPPLKPYMDHKFQVATYGLLTGVPKMSVLYIGRQVVKPNRRLDMAEFPVDKELSDKAFNMLVVTKTFWDLHFIPPIPPHIRSKSACNFCPFRRFCWEGGRPISDEFEEENNLNKFKDELADTKQKILDMIAAKEVFEEGDPGGFADIL